jgi:GxxExxY protein
MIEEDLTSQVIESAMRIHRALGPVLLESAYRECLCYELINRGFRVEKEKPLPIIYEGLQLDHGYRIDLIVNDKLVVELKTVDAFTDVHFAQVLTYLRLGRFSVGLLINFRVSLLKHGLKRFINTQTNDLNSLRQ